MFGQPASAPKPFSGLGGATSTAATATPSFFGSTNNPTSNLFGAPKPATTPTSTPGSWFGSNPAAAPVAGGGGGGLFGSTLARPPTPATAAAGAAGGGGLFGQPSAPSFSSGMFGAGSGTMGGGGGLLGQPPQPQPAAQGAGGGLFGAPGGSSMMGSRPMLFGASAPASAQTLPQPGTMSGGPPPSSLTKSTKFNDLPENVRNVIQGIDGFVRQQMQLSDELKRRDLGGEIDKTRKEWAQCSADATALSSLLLHSSTSVNSLRQRLDQDAADVEKATWIVEGYKNPQGPKAQQAKAVHSFPFDYFRHKTDEFETRLKAYKATIEQIQHHITSTTSASSSSSSSSIDPNSLVPTLKSQTASFLALASSVAGVQADLERLKDEYRWIWREKTGRVIDPFRERQGTDGMRGVERGLRGVEIR